MDEICMGKNEFLDCISWRVGNRDDMVSGMMLG